MVCTVYMLQSAFLAWPVMLKRRWPWLYGCARNPLIRFEIDFQQMDSGFILERDSGFQKLNSGFQCPLFRVPRAKISRIPESGLPYISWAKLLTLRTRMKSACSPFISTLRSPWYDMYTLFCNMIIILWWFADPMERRLSCLVGILNHAIVPRKNGEVIYICERVVFKVYFDWTKEGWENSTKE